MTWKALTSATFPLENNIPRGYRELFIGLKYVVQNLTRSEL